MDAFGEEYIVHHLPLIALSGLPDGQNASSATASQSHNAGGFRLSIDLPPLDSPLASSLSEALRSHDGSQALWKSPGSSLDKSALFRIRSVGRTLTLPPRKAPPPPHSPRLTARNNHATPAPLVLHSPISPLTPSSPLYPDGIISSAWITKHQYQLPSALLVFLSLTTNPNTSSLLDNKIKSEVNIARGFLSNTQTKLKLVIVLLSDGPISSSDVEDRIATFRRAASLDQKSLFFLPYDASQAEIAQFTSSLLSTLHPLCVEYYRDLSKHARRKRNRNATPQPTVAPTSAHVLPSQGWTVRYEFKLGVFAEFRQEMDAACKSYEAAYESLFMPEMIESIHSWSPRFNEARLLADVLALRILRCLLWTNQPTAAVKAWTGHRDRIQSLVDRRGKGTQTYGWEAWQSIWSKTMADLLRRSDVSALTMHDDILPVFASVAVPGGEKISPWEQLHHEGYWLDQAQQHIQARRAKAIQMPEEDRQPPGQSPASTIANRSQTYDTYLALEPHDELPGDGSIGYDYRGQILSNLEEAVEYFERRRQLRMCHILQLKQAVEHLKAHAWSDAVELLQPLWENQTWRASGWWDLLQHVGWTLVDCAEKLKDAELLLRLTWELGNVSFAIRMETSYDLDHVIQSCPSSEDKIPIALSTHESLSRVASSFAFVSSEGHVGEPLDCQLVLTSCSHHQTTSLSEVKIVFEGSLRPIYIMPTDSASESRAHVDVANLMLEETPKLFASSQKRSSAGAISSLISSGNLTLSPGQSRIFSFQVVPREAGVVSVASVTLCVETDRYNITITNPDLTTGKNQWWETRNTAPLCRLIGKERKASKAEILPKPPMVEVTAVNFKKAYYTSEAIQLDLEILNNEEEPANATIDARLISPVPKAANFSWLESSPPSSPELDALEQSLSPKDLESLSPSAKRIVSVRISDTLAAVDHELEVVVTYTLDSDPESTLKKALVLDIAVIRPFEANYDFRPRLTTEPWPNFFSVPADAYETQSPLGLKHGYDVTANIFSFATEHLQIEAILLTTTNISGGAVCSSSTGVLSRRKDLDDSAQVPSSENALISTQIHPEQTRNFSFELSVQKLVLGDLHTVGLDLSLEIAWRRIGSETVNTTVLEVPRFVIPMAEPRVLLTMDGAREVGPDLKLYSLRYTIENPSMHFLTFNLSMESSEEFAFSGSKASAVSLVPVSRHEVRYHIMPSAEKKGGWVRVQLNVVDAYFNQSLRLLPAGEGVKADRKGGIVVWVE